MNTYGKPLWVVGHKVTPFQTPGEYGLAEVVVTPNIPGPPPHYHATADEVCYVIQEVVQERKDMQELARL